VIGWLDGSAQASNMKLAAWATKHGVPKGTLAQYVTSNLEKRQKLGVSPGNAALLSKDHRQLVVDVIRRADRANQPKSLSEVVDVIKELAPGIGRKSARNTYDNTIKGEHSGKITGPVKAQRPRKNCWLLRTSTLTWRCRQLG
jgi:hypothetical protein